MTATNAGKAAPRPGEPTREKRSVSGRAAARKSSADPATMSPVPIAFGRGQRRPTALRSPSPAITPTPAGPTMMTTLRSPTCKTSRTNPGARAPATATNVYVSAM